MKKAFDVLLCGYYGFGNLGDELLARSLVNLLEERGLPRKRMALLSASPDESRRAFGIEAFHRWKPAELLRGIRSSRTLLLGGGGLFQDATSLRSPFYYWAVVRTASFLGCVPWCFGQSVGPMQTRTGVLLARDAMRACRVRYVRDARSRDLLQQWGLNCGMSPDLVLSLPSGPTGSAKSYILVNVRPWSGNLPERLALAATRLSCEKGIPLLGVALDREDVGLMERFRSEGRLPGTMEIRFLEPDSVHEVMGKGLMALGMRLHFNVLALLSGLPCIAVPYDPKVEAFAADWEIPLWRGEGPLPEVRTEARSSLALETARAAVGDAFTSAWGLVTKEKLNEG